MRWTISGIAAIISLVMSCGEYDPEVPASVYPEAGGGEGVSGSVLFYHLDRDVKLGSYFEFIDSIAAHFDSLCDYPLDEYYLVRANPWLVRRLEETDYYRLAARGRFVYDPGSLHVLHRGDSLLIPDSSMVDSLRFLMAATVIDVNIPEFRLRIMEKGRVVYEFPVRLGRNERRYLAMAGKTVDLRTRPGEGHVWRVERHPLFINPVDNLPYKRTRRDDGRVTLLPLIPWLDVELDGRRYGQLIHPTTNRNTLGRAFSNGCLGTGEAAAWRIYYHAPVGTKVIVRYDLEVIHETGDTLRLPDVYPGFEKYSPPASPPVAASLFPAHLLRQGYLPASVALCEGSNGVFPGSPCIHFPSSRLND